MPATQLAPVSQSRFVKHCRHACARVLQRGAAAGQSSSLTQETHKLRSGSQNGVCAAETQSALLVQLGTQWKLSRSQTSPDVPQLALLRHSTQSPIASAQYGANFVHCASSKQIEHLKERASQ